MQLEEELHRQEEELRRQEEGLRRQEAELQRMSFYETECHRKDAIVDQLYKEIGQLQQRLRVAETRRVSVNQDSSDITQKLRFLEREVAAKKEEVNDLRNKVETVLRTFYILFLPIFSWYIQCTSYSISYIIFLIFLLLLYYILCCLSYCV